MTGGTMMSSTTVPLLPEDPELRARELRLQAMKALTSRLAHDFNNYLTPILGYVTLIKEAAGAGTQAAQYAEAIERSGRKSEALLDTIMTAVRPERRCAPRETNLTELLGGLLAQWEAQIPPSIRVTVTKEFAPCTLVVEATHWQTAFQALLANARTALPTGGALAVRLADCALDAATAARLGMAAGPAHVLTVADDGIGMGPETLAQCLNPLFSTGPRGVTLGVGLTAVHSTARMHGGQVMVTSEPDRGTSVTVWFRALAVPERAVAAGGGQAAGGTGKRVLVAGCETVLQEALRSRLQEAGYMVHLAPDAAQARKLVGKHAASMALVVVDQQLPGMPGSEFVQQVRREHAELPLLLLTLEGEVAVGEVAAGRYAEMKKPFRWKGFWETVRALAG